MEPIYFGDPQNPLFGVRNEPRGAARETAILICPPLGMEYMRSYRALSLLADGLAAGGFETLRFDYSATGDSAGHSETAQLAGWLRDIQVAAEELRQLSGASRLSLLGLRLGAVLTASAVEVGLQCDALVLWDAPASGGAWIDEMVALDRLSYARKNAVRAPCHRIAAGPDELLGMPFPAALSADLRRLAPDFSAASKTRMQLITSQDHPPPSSGAGAALSLPDPGCWLDADWLTTPWTPAASLRMVADQMSRWLP